MKRVAVFAGTFEGRVLCEKLSEIRVPVTVFQTTEDDETRMEPNQYLTIMHGELSKDSINEILSGYNVVIDATHPYDERLSETIKRACVKLDIPSLRLVRDSVQRELGSYFNSTEEVVAYLNDKEGKVLITTGVKGLDAYTKVKDYKERLVVSVLPSIDEILACNMAGFFGKQIIAIDIPDSAYLNQAFIESFQIQYVVAKEGGNMSGLKEKVNAAKLTEAELLVIQECKAERRLSVEGTISLTLQFLGQ